MMSGESWCDAWLLWRSRRRWLAISVPCTMKSLMVFMFVSCTATFLLSEFWYWTQKCGSFRVDRLTFFGARVLTSAAISKLVIISGIFWLSGVDGSELLVCGEALLEQDREELDESKGNLRAAPTNPRGIQEIFSRTNKFRKVFRRKTVVATCGWLSWVAGIQTRALIIHAVD